ncbi:hypothetical protein LCGC14_0363680 [marine sediment metagenome]|uniref:Uncharacterized protein n=1 Tax=marine sediment metagenome TaxID=412755 RepID=A0A0F9TCT4_9ZZZZ
MENTVTGTQELAQRANAIHDRIAHAVTQIHAIADHLLGVVPPAAQSQDQGVMEHPGWYEEMLGFYDGQSQSMTALEQGIDRLRTFI